MSEDSDIDEDFFPMQQNHVDLLWIKNHFIDIDSKTLLNKLVEAEHIIIYMSSSLKKFITGQDKVESSVIYYMLTFLEKSLPIFFDIGARDIYKNSKDVIEVFYKHKISDKKNHSFSIIEKESLYIINHWIESAEITRIVICAIFQVSLLSGVAPNGRSL